ncbi:MAG: hypothetical protein AAFQ82_09890 [Myxococcota bacterium]
MSALAAIWAVQAPSVAPIASGTPGPEQLYSSNVESGVIEANGSVVPDWFVEREDAFWRTPQTLDSKGAALAPTDLSSVSEGLATRFTLDPKTQEYTSLTSRLRVWLRPDGVSFSPRASALPEPYREEVSWPLSELSIGSTGLNHQSTADWFILKNQAQRELAIGNTRVVETIHSSHEGVERTWLIPEPPSVNGDLTVTTLLESASAGSIPGSLAVRKHGMRVAEISPAVFIDSSGRNVSVAAAIDNGRVSYTVPSEVLADADYPAVLDPTITVARDVDPYETVELTSEDSERTMFRFADSGSGGLAVWVTTANGLNSAEIVGVRLNASGVPEAETISILTSDGNQDVNSLSVASDGTDYLVLWTTRGHSELRAARVSGGDGSVSNLNGDVWGNSATLYLDLDLARTTTGFRVLYQSAFGPSVPQSEWYLYNATYDGLGDSGIVYTNTRTFTTSGSIVYTTEFSYRCELEKTESDRVIVVCANKRSNDDPATGFDYEMLTAAEFDTEHNQTNWWYLAYASEFDKVATTFDASGVYVAWNTASSTGTWVKQVGAGATSQLLTYAVSGPLEVARYGGRTYVLTGSELRVADASSSLFVGHHTSAVLHGTTAGVLYIANGYQFSAGHAMSTLIHYYHPPHYSFFSNLGSRRVSYRVNQQSTPSLAVNDEGETLVVWADNRLDGGDVYAAYVDVDGSVGTPISVSVGSGVQTNAQVVATGTSFVVAYLNEGELKYRALVGLTTGAEMSITSESLDSYAISATESSFLVNWVDADIGERSTFYVANTPGSFTSFGPYYTWHYISPPAHLAPTSTRLSTKAGGGFIRVNFDRDLISVGQIGSTGHSNCGPNSNIIAGVSDTPYDVVANGDDTLLLAADGRLHRYSSSACSAGVAPQSIGVSNEFNRTSSGYPV